VTFSPVPGRVTTLHYIYNSPDVLRDYCCDLELNDKGTKTVQIANSELRSRIMSNPSQGVDFSTVVLGRNANLAVSDIRPRLTEKLSAVVATTF
jgi:hypothetical protein